MNYLVVGLGNIGAEYASTRHNMGFMVLDAWAQASNVLFRSERYASVAVLSFKGQKFMLVKPSTYMNLSGESIRAAMDFYSLTPQDIAVVYDESSLDLGQLRIREKGSAGGHNGMKNIIAHLGTQEFARFRVGVGPQVPGMDLADFVLKRMSREEIKAAADMALKAVEAIKAYLERGIAYAMNHYNG